MSDNIQDEFFEQAYESQVRPGRMGNLQRSINRSIEVAQNSERTYMEGETKSTNHLVFEMNEFYLEMAAKINELKLKTYVDEVDDDKDEDVEDTDSVLYEVVSAIRKKRNDPEMKKQIETVLKLDQMMEKSFKTLEEERLARQKVQDKLCDIIDMEDDDSSKTRFFRTLCDIESSKSRSNTSKVKIQSKHNENNAKSDTEMTKPRHKKNKTDDKFIKRNIQLAKNTPTMLNPAYTLTDEEKIKLDKLLVDLDFMVVANNKKCGYVVDQTKDGESDFDSNALWEKDEECDHLLGREESTTSDYPYSLSLQDQKRMKELETELENLSEVSLLANKQSTADLLDGKEWKNEDRLKQIDEKLEKLQSERLSFTFEPTEISLCHDASEAERLDDDDTANDVESISYDTLRERSQEMLECIASIMQNANVNNTPDYSDHENDEPERD